MLLVDSVIELIEAIGKKSTITKQQEASKL